MVALFLSGTDRGDWWSEELSARMPTLEVRVWPDAGDLADIEYAIVWKPPSGLLATLPKLRLILSLGAGVDHVFANPALPTGVPVCRVVDDGLTDRMREYVLLAVLSQHRHVPAYQAQQRQGDWREHFQVPAAERSVGIMGLGVLGQAIAAALVAQGFAVSGWSRRAKQIDNVRCYHGREGLAAFLGGTEILVCLLPLTPETENILDGRLFAQLPQGACLINVARGGHLVEADLLAALDKGQIAHATLDVFRTEPLPQDHPFWQHTQITITPHVASISDPRSVADQIIENIRRVGAGEALLNEVDRVRGY